MFLGSTEHFPEQLFWGDWGLGLCSDAHGEACPELAPSRPERAETPLRRKDGRGPH